MTEEYLNEIEKDNHTRIKRTNTIQQLIDQVRILRKLVVAVDGSGFDYVDGKNWFEVRDEVLNQE